MDIKTAAERVLKHRQQLQDLKIELREAETAYCEAVGEYLDATKSEDKPLVIDGVLIRRHENIRRGGYMDALDFEFINVL